MHVHIMRHKEGMVRHHSNNFSLLLLLRYFITKALEHKAKFVATIQCKSLAREKIGKLSTIGPSKFTYRTVENFGE